MSSLMRVEWGGRAITTASMATTLNTPAKQIAPPRAEGNPAEMAGLCPYPFPYQIWFDGDAVRAKTAKGLYRRGH